MTEKLPFADAIEIAEVLRQRLQSAVFGQEGLIEDALCCLLANGHLLMTGAPGLAKTTLVRVFAENMGLEFGRVQFTPDLLPSDIVGAEILNVDNATGKRYFEFAKGPVFVNLLLADEINRASPRTQSALLEAMQERATTVGGARHPLPRPFIVFATQNPFESEGTFPLPEAQLDRFLIHTLVPYPDAKSEEKMLRQHSEGNLAGEKHELAAGSRSVIDSHKLLSLMATVADVKVSEEILSAISELVRSSRPEDELCPEEFRELIWYGAGPRAGLSLISTARALALLKGVEEVRWEHIKRLAKPVMRHRIKLTATAVYDDYTEDRFIDELVDKLEKGRTNLVTKSA